MKRFFVGLAMLGAAVSAQHANAATFLVDAKTPLGSWLDTGINLTAGTTYVSTVINPDTLWSAGSNDPSSRSSDADGITTYYGQYTADGFTANCGALVGEVGGSYFLLGTGPTSFTGLSGELYIGYWDSNYGDNSGTQTVSIDATGGVPEPSTWGMMLLGFGMVGFALRARRRSSNVGGLFSAI